MTAEKPFCGGAGTLGTDFATIVAAISFFLLLKDVAMGVLSVFEFISGAFGVLAIVAAAFIGALLVITVVTVMWWQRCAPVSGVEACCAGVVNEIEPSYSNWWEYVFPFSAMHDRVDLVVKCDYWPLVTVDGTAFVKCTTHDDLVDKSPIIQCFYFSERVCNVGMGSTIASFLGGTLGVAAGVVLGLLAFAGVLAIAGCSTVAGCAPAVIIAAIIVAIVVAFVVAAVVTAAIVVAVGLIILAVTSEPEGPIVPGEDGDTEVQVGDYLSVPGNFIKHEQFDSTIVAWWTTPETTVHGSSDGNPPFTHMDPDANLVSDACPPRTADGG